MTLNVNIINEQPDPKVEEYIRRRVNLVIGRFESRLGMINVYIRDLNTNRGGVDKECSIDARLMPRGTVHVHARKGHIYAAILKAIHRLETVVSKAVDRGHRSEAVRHAQGGMRNENKRRAADGQQPETPDESTERATGATI